MIKVHKFQFFFPHHTIILFQCLITQDKVQLPASGKINKTFSTPIILKECCISIAVDALVFHPIKEVHISGYIPEGV